MPIWEEEEDDDDIDAGETWKPSPCGFCGEPITPGTGKYLAILIDEAESNVRKFRAIKLCDYCALEQLVKTEYDRDHQESGLDWVRSLLGIIE